MLHGTVKWFDSRPEKRFGFITLQDGMAEVFFHLNDGRRIKAGRLDPMFVDGERLERIPQQGDRVVFTSTSAPKGPKASAWGFEDDYVRAQRAIASRPVYRLMHQYMVVGTGTWDEPAKDWQGTSDDFGDSQLSVHYNPVFDRGSWGNEDISVRKWWEISTDGGKTWEQCECPEEYKNQFDSRGRRNRRY